MRGVPCGSAGGLRACLIYGIFRAPERSGTPERSCGYRRAEGFLPHHPGRLFCSEFYGAHPRPLATVGSWFFTGRTTNICTDSAMTPSDRSAGPTGPRYFSGTTCRKISATHTARCRAFGRTALRRSVGEVLLTIRIPPAFIFWAGKDSSPKSHRLIRPISDTNAVFLWTVKWFTLTSPPEK